MATKFLRKIILEELQKVLKEEGAAVADGSTVRQIGPGTQVGGSAPAATLAQRREAQQIVASTQGRTTYDQALQSVLNKSRLFNFGGVAQVAASTESPEQKKAAIMNLQKTMVQMKALDPKDVIGKFGPKTRGFINTYLNASGNLLLTEKDVEMMGISDINLINAGLKAGSKDDVRKAVTAFRIKTNKGIQTASNIKDPQTKLAADLAAANAKRGPQDVVLDTSTPSDKQSATPAGQTNPNQGPLPLDVLTPAEKQKYFESVKRESLTREINKLLRNL